MKTIGYALTLPVCLMIGSLACAQSAPVANVQTAETVPALPPPSAASSDPRGITTADSGSAIDKPATVGAMPQTGYHEPVIGKQSEPPPHSRTRDAAMTPTSDAKIRPDRPRTSSKQRRTRKPG